MTANKVMPLAVGVFALGVLAIVAVFVLFALGYSDLPWWLNVSATLLAPIGLAVGVAAAVRNARRKS
ncbi:hypothetical protein FKR81_22795 [Lentzea tibetensis]|uniref:Uncharacterized protein n=1 Tax=Lentzea tibetensis TaxID=2591470 RepID=A0A563EQY0_9PSEU|nr:hypothetical protein [Lentzea tibetensis]TWP50053.1 hypothetical protein FKR81_22795 [Lentzea tibetensis]